jgi:hypothetical protein
MCIPLIFLFLLFLQFIPLFLRLLWFFLWFFLQFFLPLLFLLVLVVRQFGFFRLFRFIIRNK